MSPENQPNGIQGWGFDARGWHEPGFTKVLARFSTPEEQVSYLIKTTQLLAKRIKERDRMWKSKVEIEKHERLLAVRRLQKFRLKIKRLFLFSENS